MATALPDDALTRAQAGEPAAFSLLYQALGPAVLGYFAGRGSEDPEALTQDVFLTVFSKLEAVTGGLPGLRTFTFSVAHARHVDEVRRRTRTPVLVGYEADGDTRSTESAEAVVLDRLDAGLAGGLLAQVNADQREVLLLRIVAELPIDQVAEILGRSAGSVKQLQRRGLLKLKELVQPNESEAL
ncbi:RNA polymerase sigma factor [Arthrobacter agilis]|uniref:RNA polymerase sigma factor n=1 Tax=Arthrobacter agilis TaxID=37921 RepID=UPI000B35F287|nr:RNA polymerase sigma factor [Arthrobacter agilis]PPB46850.1 RNA polymerase sigma factor [Arthrobacter agilis]TPV24890.1 RNA polymerase sigma factor [Arthrobacter agilis]WDF33651.1 RNA polymerase sigma factor [Arthrobacter agilis]VDR31052.1 RNA polymerase sigma factor SigD [Arthrobacter agilis]